MLQRRANSVCSSLAQIPGPSKPVFGSGRFHSHSLTLAVLGYIVDCKHSIVCRTQKENAADWSQRENFLQPLKAGDPWVAQRFGVCLWLGA